MVINRCSTRKQSTDWQVYNKFGQRRAKRMRGIKKKCSRATQIGRCPCLVLQPRHSPHCSVNRSCTRASTWEVSPADAHAPFVQVSAREPLSSGPPPDTLVQHRQHDSIPHLCSFPVSANHCRRVACCIAYFLTSFCLVNGAAPPVSKVMPGTEEELNEYLLFKCLRINRFINK